MTEPMSSGAGKIAQEMLKEVQSAMREQDQIAQVQGAQGAAPEIQFRDVIQNVQSVNQIDGIGPMNDATHVLRAARAGQVSSVPEIPAIGQAADQHPALTGIQRVMEDVMQGQNKLEEIINLGLSGRSFSTPELLAMQASVFRFSQELELTSKVVEKATATIKQTMNTQV